ncbi:hypothetical protein FS749_009096 [Ceratobasidium sp. UAMH 11750]|nr:hypothetical protein FS749_009096 [Ceratobasidium sp. UAMH 11750]
MITGLTVADWQVIRLVITKSSSLNTSLQCVQIATGLAYLHKINIVHGDLKGANVLLSNDGVAQITDFGNAVLGSSTLAFTESTTRSHLSTRWAAPEQLDDKVAHSREADVYSLGMTILEVISRQKPYANIGTENAVITTILIKKQHPQRPEDTIPTESKHGDTLWSLLELCWSWNPEDRPEAIEVTRTMRRIKQKDLLIPTHGSQELQNAHFPMELEGSYMPPSLQRPRTVSLPLITPHASRSGTPSRNLSDAEAVQEKHRIAFMRAERDAEASLARGDADARYIFNGFPIWVNWDLYTRLENLERQMRGRELLPRASRPHMRQAIYREWYITRNKWADRLRDPKWARFMNETGRILAARLLERQTSIDHALNSARAYFREKTELPFSRRQDRGEYRWDNDYRHREWRWVEERTWRWIVERENDERREKGRVPLPRYVSGMSQGNWRDVWDVWYTIAYKWLERLNDPEWVARDQRESACPERQLRIRKKELARRQHGVVPRSIDYKSLNDGDVWHTNWPYWDSVSPPR